MAGEGDTIFAAATPPGKSAIAVIRISGDAAATVPAHFGSVCPQPDSFALRSLCDKQGVMIDQALMLFMQSPRSSTGEDVLEIHCHGGVAVVRTLLDALAIMPGLRVAEPGEFTHRMFHNGKIDLLGVESLADVIDAETSRQLGQAWSQMQGALRDPVMRWRDDVISIAAELEAVIDFPDEEIPPTLADSIIAGGHALIAEIEACLDDNTVGERLRAGVNVTLLGPVNAGKSTLLNRIANRPVAIVSPEAGTTRDLVSVSLDIKGVPVTLTDTAGIRDGAGVVEEEGIARALMASGEADHTIIVIDGSAPQWMAHYADVARHAGVPHSLVLNKSDQGVVGDIPKGAIIMSLLDDRGIDEFLDHLSETVTLANDGGNGAIITRARHRQALEVTVRALKMGLGHDLTKAPELAGEDFRLAATALGRITGAIDVEDLLDAIFSSFCIGK
jgi:tRNA modification GTPase